MISLTVTGLFNCTDLEIICGTEVFKVGRCYIGSARADSYPNSLVFKISNREVLKLVSTINESDATTLPANPWLAQELQSISSGDGFTYFTVPFTIRRAAEPFANFRRVRSNNRIVRLTGELQVFVGGQAITSLCTKCPRRPSMTEDGQEVPARCPDYNSADILSLNCLKTTYFVDSSEDINVIENRVHYINTGGELVYAEPTEPTGDSESGNSGEPNTGEPNTAEPINETTATGNTGSTVEN